MIWLQTKDLYIVDKRLSRCNRVNFLEERGLSVKMSVYLKKKVPNSILQKSPQHKDMMDSRNHF